jgi:hypothetical protein
MAVKLTSAEELELFPEQLRMALEDIQERMRVDDTLVFQSRRARRFARRRVSAIVSASRSVVGCGQSLLEGQLVAWGVGVMTPAGQPRSGLTGVWRCGKLHLCPDCAAKGREKRARTVNDAARIVSRAGGHMAFVTHTIARAYPTEPVDLHTAALVEVNTRFARLLKDSGFYGDAQVIGNIMAWEWTMVLLGTLAGHPHLMRLWFYWNPAFQGEWHRVLAPLWVKAALECGRRASLDHGTWVEYPELQEDGTLDVLARYVTKGGSEWGAGQELTRSDRKSGRADGAGYAPFEILDEIEATGEGAEAWRAYERASKGKPIAKMSHGLAKTLKAIEAGEIVSPCPSPVEEESDADVVLHEEASVLDEGFVGEVRYVGVAGSAIRWVGARPGFQDLFHRIIEASMLIERDTGRLPDVAGAIRGAAEDWGAPPDVLYGIMGVEEAEAWEAGIRGLEVR